MNKKIMLMEVAMKINGKINAHQFTCMIILFILGASLVFGTAPQSGKDVGFAIIISLAFTYIYTLMYLKLFSYYPGKNLFDIIEDTLGKYLGKIVSFLFVFYCIYTIGVILFDFKSLLLMVDISETPGIVVTLFFGVLIVYGLRSGIEALGRWSTYFFIIILTFIVISVAMEIQVMEIDNILPFFSTGIKDILMGSYAAFTFPFGEIFIFAGIIDSINDHRKLSKVFRYALLIGGFLIFCASLAEVLVLGYFEYSISYFPAYIALSRVNVSIVQRLEILGAPLLIITGYLKVYVYMVVACKGMKKIFNLSSYKVIAIPMTLMAVLVTHLQSESMMAHWEWGAHIWPFFSTPFLLIIPSVMFIIALIKNRKSKASN